MQLIISGGLLKELRLATQPYGRLLCDLAAPEVLLARGLPKGDRVTYSQLTIDATEPIAQARLPWLRSDPASDTSALQPYVDTLLKDELGLLLVIADDQVRLLRRRAAPLQRTPQWLDVSVVETPIRLSDVGIDPNLKGQSVAIVGIGSIGSRVAELLAAAGIARLVLIDPDRVELRNLRRHVCSPDQIGQLKVDALRVVLERACFDVELETFAVGVPRQDAPDIREALSTCNLLICCADSGPAQHYVNHLARHTGIPAIIASVKLLPQTLGEVVLSLPEVPGCLNCWRLKLETDKLMMRADTHDPADYPGETAETPQGLPAHLLDQVVATTANYASHAHSETKPRIWLNPLERPVDGFPDLEVGEPRSQLLESISTCLVCGGK